VLSQAAVMDKAADGITGSHPELIQTNLSTGLEANLARPSPRNRSLAASAKAARARITGLARPERSGSGLP
jgi:hypothetical protein